MHPMVKKKLVGVAARKRNQPREKKKKKGPSRRGSKKRVEGKLTPEDAREKSETVKRGKEKLLYRREAGKRSEKDGLVFLEP